MGDVGVLVVAVSRRGTSAADQRRDKTEASDQGEEGGARRDDRLVHERESAPGEGRAHRDERGRDDARVVAKQQAADAGGEGQQPHEEADAAAGVPSTGA